VQPPERATALDRGAVRVARSADEFLGGRARVDGERRSLRAQPRDELDVAEGLGARERGVEPADRLGQIEDEPELPDGEQQDDRRPRRLGPADAPIERDAHVLEVVRDGSLPREIVHRIPEPAGIVDRARVRREVPQREVVGLAARGELLARVFARRFQEPVP